MNVAEFDELTKVVISPLLEDEHGFLFLEGTYFRDLPSKVRHVVMFDFDARKGKTFRVILGVNSPIITDTLSPNEAGAFGIRYLSDSGITKSPSSFPCFSREAAVKSLNRVGEILNDEVISWLSSVDSVEKAADLAEDQYPFIKGKLYFSAGLLEKAKQYLSQHLSYLLKQQKSEQVIEGIKETQEMLKHCF
jgi:hypothetical protein